MRPVGLEARRGIGVATLAAVQLIAIERAGVHFMRQPRKSITLGSQRHALRGALAFDRYIHPTVARGPDTKMNFAANGTSSAPTGKRRCPASLLSKFSASIRAAAQVAAARIPRTHYSCPIFTRFAQRLESLWLAMSSMRCAEPTRSFAARQPEEVQP